MWREMEPDQALMIESRSSAGGAHEERLFRLLRYAAVHGVVDTHPGSRTPPQTAQSVRFRNNRLSAVLREDHPNSQKHMVGCSFGAFDQASRTQEGLGRMGDGHCSIQHFSACRTLNLRG